MTLDLAVFVTEVGGYHIMDANKTRIARQKKRKKRVRSMGDLDGVRSRLWQAISVTGDMLTDEEQKPELRLKAVHAITQATGAYMKIVEATEFEARLKAVEKRLLQGEIL